ncbi:MAG TPA: hypothetical protein VGM87_22790 [Roseomonas sp.]|jgi:hypothetical protein
MLSDICVALTMLSALAMLAGLVRPRLFGGDRRRVLLLGLAGIIASLLGAGATLTPRQRAAIDASQQARLNAAAIADGMRGATVPGRPQR